MRKQLAAVLTAAMVVTGVTATSLPALARSPDPVPLGVALGLSDAVNLAGSGLVPVVVRTAEGVDATGIDLDTIALSGDDPDGSGVAPARPDSDAVAPRSDQAATSVHVVDADGDGRDDLVVHFDKDDLLAAGALTPDTTELFVTAQLDDGRVVEGSAPVTPEVRIELKFDEELRVRGTDRTLRSQRGRSLQPVREVLDRHGGGELRPMIDAATATRLGTVAADAQARAPEPVPDLPSWYTVTLPAGVDADAAVADLAGLDQVAHAYPAPEPAPPPQATDTPDFTDLQVYFAPADQNGIDADFSRQDPRIRGDGIKIVDLEYDWNPFHEDLQLDWSTDLGGDHFPRFDGFGDDHGTAVFGQLVAVDNDFGVTGGVPDAEMYGISPTQQVGPGTSWQPGAALAFLAALEDEDGEPFLQPGDAVLLEQQTNSPDEVPGSFAPLEWIPSVFEAIETLTAMGVNVVSTGGNGNTDSDHPGYTRDGENGWFDPEFQHSGSILVGAGGSGLSSAGARERLSFSNHGTRFDLQGWGQDIVTTGYCSLYCDPDDHDIRYSQTFSGTSGAGPIVTSAVVAVQSYVTSTGQDPWGAQEIADVLAATGQPQGPDTADEHIGPLPDLEAALRTIEVDPPETTLHLEPRLPTDGTPGAYSYWVEFEADDGWGSGVDVTDYRIDGGDWTTFEDGDRVAISGVFERTLEYRSTDGNGNVEDVQSRTFGRPRPGN